MGKKEKSTFGQRLRELREAAGLSQRELAVKLGDRRLNADRKIRRWENGEYLPPAKLQRKLASVFGISVEEMVGGDVLTGAREIYRRLRPYALQHLGEIGKQMQVTREEILQLLMQPLLDDASRFCISNLEEKYEGQLRYFKQIVSDLEKVEKLL